MLSLYKSNPSEDNAQLLADAASQMAREVNSSDLGPEIKNELNEQLKESLDGAKTSDWNGLVIKNGANEAVDAVIDHALDELSDQIEAFDTSNEVASSALTALDAYEEIKDDPNKTTDEKIAALEEAIEAMQVFSKSLSEDGDPNTLVDEQLSELEAELDTLQGVDGEEKISWEDSNLEDMTMGELTQLAKDLGETNLENKSLDELIALIMLSRGTAKDLTEDNHL